MLARMWSSRNSHKLLVEMQNGTATLEDGLVASDKVNIHLPNDLAVVLHGIYPEGLKASVHTKMCTWIFTAALFIISITWKQPRCPSAGEWKNKMGQSNNGITQS